MQALVATTEFAVAVAVAFALVAAVLLAVMPLPAQARWSLPQP